MKLNQKRIVAVFCALAAGLAVEANAQGVQQAANKKALRDMPSVETYFRDNIAGTQKNFADKKVVKAGDVSAYQTMVWDAWRRANKAADEEHLIQLGTLDSTAVGKWHLPQLLEPNAVMPYYYGRKTANNDGTAAAVKGGRLPFFLYLHGSGPKAQEWSNGLKLAAWFKDAPSIYFIPQIPNEGNYYRWWQKGKQWAWEKLLRQALLSDDVDANRVYVFGISEGGYGSQRLASFYADYWAAAGPMAGGEPLRNAPVENCANIGFSLLTGAKDNGFFRNYFTNATRVAFDSLQALHPDQFKHRIELIPGRAHHIDYSPTTPWLSQFVRNPYPKHVMWEDFDMDGRHRTGFYNLRVNQRQQLDPMSRTCYTMDINNNVVDIKVQTVKYTILETDPYWHSIEMAFSRHYEPATSGSFTVYLNNELVDMSRKVTVVVNGKKVFAGKLKPSLENMVESVATYSDPYRIYPAAVEVQL